MFSAVLRIAPSGKLTEDYRSGHMKRKRSLVDIQKTNVRGGSDASYQQYADAHSFSETYEDGILSSDGSMASESTRANPDVLPESQSSAPSNPQLIMGEAVEHLQGRQKEVYTLIMRESKSLAEAGEILGISKGTAATYLERAIKFIAQYCKVAIKGGRV